MRMVSSSPMLKDGCLNTEEGKGMPSSFNKTWVGKQNPGLKKNQPNQFSGDFYTRTTGGPTTCDLALSRKHRKQGPAPCEGASSQWMPCLHIWTEPGVTRVFSRATASGGSIHFLTSGWGNTAWQYHARC